MNIKRKSNIDEYIEYQEDKYSDEEDKYFKEKISFC